MAEKEKKEKKGEAKLIVERQYNIPMRKEFLKVPKFKRAKKAVRAVKEFLIRHLNSELVYLDNGVNLALWKHGIKNPPHHIKVNVKKYDDGKVVAYYAGDDFKLLNRLKKLADRDKVVEKKPAKKTEAKKEDKADEAKAEPAKKEHEKAHEHKAEPAAKKEQGESSEAKPKPAKKAKAETESVE